MENGSKRQAFLEFIRAVQFPNKSKRFDVLFSCLRQVGLKGEVHRYASGRNVIVSLGRAPYIGLGSHYDVVPGSPGANDNASAMAVTLEVLARVNEKPLRNVGLRGFFFDEEEYGLRGSRAYVRERGVGDMMGLYNMELVGSGNNLAFWAEGEVNSGLLLRAIEETARAQGVKTYRIPDISRFLMNSGDQESFIRAGMREAFCITAVSEKDLTLAAGHGLVGDDFSLRSREQQTASSSVDNIMQDSDLFKHYHKPTDVANNLSEKTLKIVADVLYRSILRIDERQRAR